MKIFQIIGNFCHWDATNQLKNLAYAVANFPATDVFVEAPDFVFEGWGYDPLATGDARFIRPTPPEGWNYDEKTGTFYPEEGIAPSAVKSNEELMQGNTQLQETVTELELALAEVYEMTITLANGGVING